VIFRDEKLAKKVSQKIYLEANTPHPIQIRFATRAEPCPTPKPEKLSMVISTITIHFQSRTQQILISSKIPIKPIDKTH
jgi:hypothetical protein